MSTVRVRARLQSLRGSCQGTTLVKIIPLTQTVSRTIIVQMGGFVLGIAVGVVINLVTAFFNRKAAVKLVPWLCLYIAVHGAFLLVHEDGVNTFAMNATRKYPHWLSYLIVVGGIAILAAIYWHVLLRGVAWLDAKTSEHTQSSPAHAATNDVVPPVKEPAPAHKTKTVHAEQLPALSFRAFWVGVGNMPERSQVTNTWNGKPWDENDYADVRLTITSTADLALQDVDLDISVAKEDPKTGIAGIAQLTNISGVEFHKPPLIPGANAPSPRKRTESDITYRFQASHS